jgi:hypothetical protein
MAPPILNVRTVPRGQGYFVSPKDFVKNFTKFLHEIQCRDFIDSAMPKARVRERPLLAEINAVVPLPQRTF